MLGATALGSSFSQTGPGAGPLRSLHATQIQKSAARPRTFELKLAILGLRPSAALRIKHGDACRIRHIAKMPNSRRHPPLQNAPTPHRFPLTRALGLGDGRVRRRSHYGGRDANRRAGLLAWSFTGRRRIGRPNSQRRLEGNMALLPPIVARVNFRNAADDRFVFRALLDSNAPTLTETANKAE